jgi:O-antigen ligase
MKQLNNARQLFRLRNERERGREGNGEKKTIFFSPTHPLTHSPTQSLLKWLRIASLLFSFLLLGAALARYSDSPILIVLFLSFLAIATFAAIEYVLYAMLFFMSFSFRYILPSQTEVQMPTEPLVGILICAYALRKIVMRKKLKIPPFPFRFPLLAYAAALILSCFVSPWTYVSVKGTIRYIAYMLVSLLAYGLIRTRRHLAWLFIISIIPATIAVGWTASFLFTRLDQWQWSSAYEGLPFTNYQIYGSFIAVIFLILLSRMIFDRGIYDKVIWTTLTIFYFIALCSSFSRGVWISVAAAIIFILFQRAEGIQHKKILVSLGIVAFIGLIITMPGVSDIVAYRASTMFNTSFASNKARLLRWAAAIVMFLRHPIIGAGYEVFALSYKNDPELIGAVSKYQMGAHNEYLQVLAETGIIGFVSWMWIIIAFFAYGFKLLRRLEDSYLKSLTVGLMAAELSLLVHFIVNGLFHADKIAVPFWLIYGLLPAISEIAKENSQ